MSGADATAALVVAVRAGAADDNLDRRGLAHLVEHMVLRRCRDEHAPWSVNGLTSSRMTVFESVTTGELLPRARVALLRALREPLVLSDHDLHSEFDVIEVEARSDRTSAKVLGPPEERRRITTDEVITFHDRHYRGARPHVVSVASGLSAPPPVPAPAPGATQLDWREVHSREDPDLTRVVIVFDGGDSGHAALMLGLCYAVDPQLPRLLTLPVVSGRRRVAFPPGGGSLTVSVQLTVERHVTAVAFAIAGASDAGERIRWLTHRFRRDTAPPAYRFADPLLQARWQAYWDLTVDGGWPALDAALAEPPAQAWHAVADAVDKAEGAVGV